MKKNLLLALLLLFSALGHALTSGSWYTISVNSKGIIIPEASVSNNVPLMIYTQTPVPSHMWQLTDNGDGTVSFMEGYMNSYLCYSVFLRAGTKITARSALTKRTYGAWVLKPVDGKADTYYISVPDGTLVIGVDSKEDGGRMTLVDPATASPELTQWTIREYSGKVSTSFDTDARDAIMNAFISHYYHTAVVGSVLGSGGWWGDAEMFETILDAFETTGDKTYQTYFQRLVSNFVSRNRTDWSYNQYNDDITWMVLACIRGYKYFNSSTYLNYAKNNFDKMYERALETGGALRWNQEKKNWYGSNSCINGPATVAACYLYEITGDAAYLDKAKSIYAFQRSKLFNATTGQVYDSGSWDSSWTTFTVGNQWASTYNQGTMLGAATKLYILTGEAKYKTDADRIWDYTRKNLCNSIGIIHVCQTATGDLCGFKGILMRYVRLYGQTFNHEDVMDWMAKNAWFAYQNANSKGIIWSKWLTKTTEDFKDGTNSFYNDAFGASTAVSVAFNAHINRRFIKDAYTSIGAEVFDDIKFMQISPNFDDDGVTPNTTRTIKGYICFKNVDFGSYAATKAKLRLYSSSNGGAYRLYADKISDATLIGTVDGLSLGWNSYEIPITETTGIHSIYAVPESIYATMFHTMQFDNTASGIESVASGADANGADAVYNIAGQRLAEPRSGISIVNGRKVVLK